MNTNINIDNYEAYLLDYMEGNLSPEGAAALQAFVATQGLDWDELTEPLLHLDTPQVAYEGKEKLKKKAVVVPLYAKIASAAAAGALLLTVGLWPEKQLPKAEPVAELKPILPERLITKGETDILPKKTVQFALPQTVTKEKTAVSRPVPERVEVPMVAQLAPQKAQVLPVSASFDEPDFGLLAYQMNASLAFAPIEKNGFEEDFADRDLSFIGRAIFRLTEGRHDSFASLINAGVGKAKQDLALAATDMALAAYQKAEDSFGEARERWEEKHGE